MTTPNTSFVTHPLGITPTSVLTTLATTTILIPDDDDPTTTPPLNDTTPYAPIDPPINKCNYYIHNNSAHLIKLANEYGGIPQNLAINVVAWVVLMLLFALLRRWAGNFGRLALVRKDDDESRWTQLFFAPDDISTVGSNEEAMLETDSLTSVDYSDVDNGMCSWITSIFTLTDEKFMRKCGTDAVQYLKFQRHLIILVLIMTVVCIVVILPINFQGTSQGSEVDFGHTTISNLEGRDSRLWIHIVMAILFLPLGIFIMRRFSVNLKIEEEECISSRTLMIGGVPKTYCTKEFLIRHFHEAYPQFEIDDVQIAFDVSKLSSLDERRERSRRARLYCENMASKHGAGQQMKPFACGIVCNMCACGSVCKRSRVDALTFYKKEEMHLQQEVDKEKARIQTKNIGLAFVTFATLADAKQVNKDHVGRCQCLTSPPTSSLSNILQPQSWAVRFAPPPEDIYWENLNSSHRFFFLKALSINLILFITLFFFSSPTYILGEIKEFLTMTNATSHFVLPEKINDFVPTLTLWTLSALIPVLVAYSDWWMGHWRRSSENLWIMRKVFFYLLFMVLILPSIGLTTLKALFEFFVKSSESESYVRWECIFLPDNGAFFVNYVITSALVGIGLEFMRFSELFMYAMRMLFVRSVAETPSVRKANLYEFPFGFNYGWMLLIFALTAAYCVICPLITPFGLFYLLMKHGVDRYNLYYAYKRSKINKSMHATAVNCVIVSLLIQQLILLFFNIIRGQSGSNKVLSPRAIFSITMFTIFCLMFIVQIFFHFFKGFSPIQYVAGINNGNNGGGGDAPEPEVDPHDIIASASALNVPSSRPGAQKSRRHKQFVPDVLRRDVFTQSAPLVPYNSVVNSDSATFQSPTNVEAQLEQQNSRRRQPSPSAAYGSIEVGPAPGSEEA